MTIAAPRPVFTAWLFVNGEWQKLGTSANRDALETLAETEADWQRADDHRVLPFGVTPDVADREESDR